MLFVYEQNFISQINKIFVFFKKIESINNLQG